MIQFWRACACCPGRSRQGFVGGEGVSAVRDLAHETHTYLLNRPPGAVPRFRVKNFHDLPLPHQRRGTEHPQPALAMRGQAMLSVLCATVLGAFDDEGTLVESLAISFSRYSDHSRGMITSSEMPGKRRRRLVEEMRDLPQATRNPRPALHRRQPLH